MAGAPVTSRAIVGISSMDYLGAVLADAGDVNGDGYSDIVVATIGLNSVNGYWGGPTGLPTTPSVTLACVEDCPVFDWLFPTTLSSGDYDGDGYSDVLVGFAVGQGHVYVYRGGTQGLPNTPSAKLVNPNPSGGSFGVMLAPP